MRVTRYNFLFVIGLFLTLGLSTAFANSGDNKNKPPKGMGTLSVRTTPSPMPIRIDNVDRGMSGVSTGAEFYLTPGPHKLEVTGPNGVVKTMMVEVVAGGKNCVCLKLVEEKLYRPCPYTFHLEGPDRVTEGDLITFAAINSGSAPIPIRYAWKVSNGRITSGLNSPTITVDTKGMGGQNIDAELDVNDDVYDNKCRQVISVPTSVEKIIIPPPIEKVQCDQFEARTDDEAKARYDNCAIMLSNTPDAMMYIHIYPGTDKLSMTRNTYARLSKKTLDYLVNRRGVDPRKIQILKGSPVLKTTYEIWIVPPGAIPPVIR